MKLTKYKLSLLILTLVMFVTLTAFFCLNTFTARASGTVSVGTSNVFNATGDAEVKAGAVGDKFYTTFTFMSGEDAVSYRRNLAYHWFEQLATDDDEEDGDEFVAPVKSEGWFSMEVGFPAVSFDRFIITFESQEYNKSKDSKAVNYLILFPSGEDKVYALITTDKDASEDDIEDAKKVGLDAGKLTVKFDGKYVEDFTSGYNVVVTDGNANVKYKLENVAGNFAKSSTSTSSPLYPLIFNAELTEDDDNEVYQSMNLYSINGQSFEMEKESSTTVTDTMPPVLCLNEQLRFFEKGGKISIDYTVIDVLRTSPSATIYYYVLTDEQYVAEDINYSDTQLFEEVDDDYIILSGKDKYMPSLSDVIDTKFNSPDVVGNLTVDMLLKVYIQLSDYSSDTYKETSIVYLDWYIDSDYLIDYKDSAFIAVAKDELGATYAYDGIDGVSWAENGKVADYQAKIDELAKDLSAGTSSYLYLPSVESLFTDNSSAYTDMKYSVYYKHNSTSSNTNLASTNLSINLTQKGWYTFTIYATDAAGNNMYYLEKTDDAYNADELINGVYYNYVEFSASEIWDMYDDREEGGLFDKLPWFNFYVDYTGVQFEKTPGMQTTAYVGTSYSPSSFSINGISGSYDTNYRLFEFLSADYYNDFNGKTFTYEEFLEVMDDLFENSETRKYFREIFAVTETDAEYEEFKDYEWSNSSISFVPQVQNTFYYMRATVKDNDPKAEEVTCSLAILSSATAKTLKGENDWLKNNIASVILLVVAGLSLVGIILLLVIKPKNKEDLDVQYEKSRKKKSK